MKINPLVTVIKQLSRKISPSLYTGVQHTSNLQHASYIRQLQRELRRVDHLDIPLEELSVVVFDIETTGFSPTLGDQILSIGAIRVTGNRLHQDHCFYQIVQSHQPLTSEIRQLTGLSEEELHAAPPITEVLAQFYQFTQERILVAHHSNHEKNFMQHVTWNASRTPFQHRIVDTSFLIKVSDPSLSLSRLEDICTYCGIEIIERHHALGDAKMTAKLWTHYIDKVTKLGYSTLRDIYQELGRLQS